MAKKSLKWVLLNALILAGLAALSVLPESILGLTRPELMDAAYRAVYTFLLVLLLTLRQADLGGDGNGGKAVSAGNEPAGNPAPGNADTPPKRLGMVI